MKTKIFIGVLTIIVSMALVNTVFASNEKFIETSKKINMELIDQSQDKDVILGAIDEKFNNLDSVAKNFNWSKRPVKHGEYYKIYILHDNIRKYYNDKSLDKLIEGSEQIWETPLLDEKGNIVTNLKAYNVDNKYTVTAGHSIPIECIQYYNNPENILKTINENGISNPNTLKHIRIQPLHIDFLYISDGEAEYAIPLADRPDELGIANFQLYKMENFMDKLSKKYIDPSQEKINQDHSEAKYGGSEGLQRNQFMGYVSIAVALICLIAFIVLLRKYKFSRNNI